MVFPWQNQLNNKHIFFISPDVKRALGLEDILSNYHIICSSKDCLIPVLRNQGANIFCLEEQIGEEAANFNNSGRLLEHKEVLNYINKKSTSSPYIMYFKPSIKLDFLIEKMGFKPIGNKAFINERFENKINFCNFLRKNLPDYAINSETGRLGEMDFNKTVNELRLPLVIQFGHGWAGNTTFIVKDEGEFCLIKNKYPATIVKISKYISGLSVLNNCCIYDDTVFISPPALQLNNIANLHQNPAVTCGRQWPAKFISKSQAKEIYLVSKKIGKLMGKIGSKGFFGLDFIIEKRSGKVYLSELNARLTASSGFYTYLERGLGHIPLLAYHIADFLDADLPKEKISENGITGSQIILRKPTNLSNQYKDYGIYKYVKNNLIKMGDDYHPQNLNLDELIFIPRMVSKNHQANLEIARIETKQQVVDNSLIQIKKQFMLFITK